MYGFPLSLETFKRLNEWAEVVRQWVSVAWSVIHPSIHPKSNWRSIYPFRILPSIRLFICPSVVHSSIHPTPFLHPSIHQSMSHPSTHPSRVHLLSAFHPFDSTEETREMIKHLINCRLCKTTPLIEAISWAGECIHPVDASGTTIQAIRR